MRVLSAFLISSVVFLSFSSCSREFYEGEASYPRRTALSVAEARRYVESQLASRTRSGDASEWNTLTLGHYTADWSRAATSEGRALYSVDVPVTGEYVYYQIVDDSIGRPELLPMYHKLVVVKDKNCDSVGCYIRFYLPALSIAFAYDADYFDSLLNSHPKRGFTGLSIHTTLEGFPVSAGRYQEGALRDGAFLRDSMYAPEENRARLSRLLDGILAARVAVREGRTRSGGAPEDGDSIAIRGDVDVVVVIGKIDHKKDGGVGGGKISTLDPKDDGQFIGGGGDNPSGSEDKPSPDSYAKNPKIKTNSGKVNDCLDQLFKDCLGETLINRLGDVTIEVTESVKYGVISYSPAGNTLVGFHIQLNPQFNDFMLMEELLHRYQLTGVTPADEHKYRLNREIEAKIGWFMYRQREDRANDIMVKRGLGGDAGIDIFNSLSDYVVTRSTNTTEFAYTFMGAEGIIRQIPGYSDPEKYPFCEDNINIDKLLDLMAGCLSTIYNQNK